MNYETSKIPEKVTSRLLHQSETSLSWFEETPRDAPRDHTARDAARESGYVAAGQEEAELDIRIEGGKVPEIRDKQSVYHVRLIFSS